MSRIEENYLVDLEFSGDFVAAPNGDLNTITGMANLKQALFNRLITAKGSLAHRPTYGVGIQQWQNALGSFEKQRQLALEIKKQFKEDPRVVDVTSVSIKPDPEKPGLFTIQYKVEAVGIGTLEDTINPFGDFSL